MKKLIVFITTLLCLTPCFGAENALLNQAQEAYQKGDFQEAVRLYEALSQKIKNNANLKYNLGNAYYQTKEYGKAICFYEKALKLSPRDSDIQYNLTKAKQQIIDQTLPTKQSFLLYGIDKINIFSINELLLSGIILLMIFNSLFILIKINPQLKIKFHLRMTYMGVFIIIMSLIWSLFLILKIHKDIWTQKGVIIVPQTEIKSGPENHFSTVCVLHEGTQFKIKEKQNSFALIQLNSKTIGWILITDFWKI